MFLPLLFAASIQSPVPPCAASDTADVAQFISQFLAALPPAEKTARGSFVLVCGDHIAYASGYGKAANGSVVDPERTLFRAASNSKLITATAAVQLAASGRWKLTDDVNRYLPDAAKLKDGFGRQVTIADLLTHTAGFEDKFAGSIALTSDMISLAEFFARHRPNRVRPAGVEVGYSNIGTALAGYAVEVATKQSFADYAATHIFVPLGMTRSTFAQPLPAAWQADVASAVPKGARGIGFLPYPAASLVTTPADMGRFIAAHLSAGATPTGRILPSETVSDMHASHWRAQPAAPEVAYGFFEGEMNGHRTLFHTGDSGDHSLVFLLPEERIGFYFVYSGSDEQAIVREKLVRAFMDRYFPLALSAVVSIEVPSPRDFVGIYRGAAYSRTNYEKLKAMFYQVVIRVGGNGALEITPPGGGTPVKLTARAPNVFAGDSGEVVAFRRDASGVVAGFTLSGSIWDPQSFDRIGRLQDGRLHAAAFAIIVLSFIVRLLATPVMAVVRRVRPRPNMEYSPEERMWWRWSGIVSALAIVTPIIGLGVAFLSFRPGAVAVPRAAFVVGIWLAIVSLAGLALLPAAVTAWRRSFWSPARRVVFTAVAIGCLIGAPLLAFWRVLPL